MSLFRLSRGCVVGLAVVMAALVGTATPAFAAGTSSFGAQAAATVNSTPITLGPTPTSTVGNSPNSLGSTNTSLFATGALTTTATQAANGNQEATSTVASMNLGFLGLTGNSGTMASTCTSTSSGTTGNATLQNLTVTIAGTPVTIPANPGPNTVVEIKVPPIIGITVATITLNEQITSGGSLTVNAFHLRLLDGVTGSLGSGDIIFASVTCGPFVAPVPMLSGVGAAIGGGLLAAVGGAVFWFRRRLTA